MKNILLALAVTVLLLLGLFLAAPLLYGTAEAQDTATVVSTGNNRARVVIWADQVVVVTSTQTVISAVQDVRGSNSSETQLVVDQGTSVNSVNVFKEHSNDGLHWTEQDIAGKSLNSDSNIWLLDARVTGIYNRITVKATNTNPVTITVISILESDEPTVAIP